MVQHARGSGRFVDEDWHAFREEARHTEHDEEVFSDIEQERFDLETARITGEEHEQAFVNEPYGDDREPFDARETNPRRM